MRVYYRPRGSSLGVSTGWIGTLILLVFWLFAGLFLLFFVWPFQLIWRGLPQYFPGSRSLPAWQVGLTLVWIGVLIALIAVGSNSKTGGAATPTQAPNVVLTCADRTRPTMDGYGALNCDDYSLPTCPDGSGAAEDQSSDPGYTIYTCNGQVVSKGP